MDVGRLTADFVSFYTYCFLLLNATTIIAFYSVGPPFLNDQSKLGTVAFGHLSVFISFTLAYSENLNINYFIRM